MKERKSGVYCGPRYAIAVCGDYIKVHDRAWGGTVKWGPYGDPDGMARYYVREESFMHTEAKEDGK